MLPSEYAASQREKKIKGITEQYIPGKVDKIQKMHPQVRGVIIIHPAEGGIGLAPIARLELKTFLVQHPIPLWWGLKTFLLHLQTAYGRLRFLLYASGSIKLERLLLRDKKTRSDYCGRNRLSEKSCGEGGSSNPPEV